MDWLAVPPTCGLQGVLLAFREVLGRLDEPGPAGVRLAPSKAAAIGWRPSCDGSGLVPTRP